MEPNAATPRWVEAALAVLAVPNLLAGAWAIVAPRSWFDSFPGWAPHLVAALPPFNEHLATDAGAGLLTVGVLATIALLLRRRDVVVTAMAGALTFSVPHAMFHLLHPAEALSSAEDAMNSISLIGAAALAGAVLAHAWRQT